MRGSLYTDFTEINPSNADSPGLHTSLLEIQSRLRDLTQLRDGLITEPEYFQDEVTSTRDPTARHFFLDVMQTRGWALQDVKVVQIK